MQHFSPSCCVVQFGEKCCIDDPILEDIILSDEALNWNGQKRCCMHNEGKRTLDDLDLDALINPDLAKISDKIFNMGSKAKAYCEGLQRNTQEAFQTCRNLQGAIMGEEFIPPTLPQEKTQTQIVEPSKGLETTEHTTTELPPDTPTKILQGQKEIKFTLEAILPSLERNFDIMNALSKGINDLESSLNHKVASLKVDLLEKIDTLREELLKK